MSLDERHWWLRALEALIVSAALLAVVAWYLAYGLPVDRRGAPYPVEDTLLVGGLVVMLGGTAARLLLGARRARQRDLARRRAIAGYQDALPLARAVFAGPDVAQPESGPIDTRAKRAWLGVLVYAAFMVGVAWLVGAGSGEYVHPMIVAIHHTVMSDRHQPTHFYPTAALLAGYVLAISAIGWFYFEMLLLAFARRHPRVRLPTGRRLRGDDAVSCRRPAAHDPLV